MDGLEEKYSAEFTIVRENVGKSSGKQLAREYVCIGTPAYVLFDKTGEQVRRFQGSQTTGTFEQEIERILAQ